jgi:hypothetical protein
MQKIWTTALNRPHSIDFSKLAKPFTAHVPVLNNSFILNKKRYAVTASDGWWVVEISGNKVKAVDPYYWVTNPPSGIGCTGYTYNNDLIFSNFDVAKRKWKLEMKAFLHFNAAETFSPVRAVLWEDKRAYYVMPWYEDFKSLEVKSAFDTEAALADLKGLTPELQTVHVFHSLERVQLRALLAQQEERVEHERRMSDVGYRLKHTFELSGAELLNFSRSGERLIVEWTIRGGSYKYNSVLDADTLRVREAGFCMSGADRDHSATSLVLTAEEYEKEHLTYITRW